MRYAFGVPGKLIGDIFTFSNFTERVPKLSAIIFSCTNRNTVLCFFYVHLSSVLGNLFSIMPTNY